MYNNYNNYYRIVSFRVMGVEQIDRFALIIEQELTDLRLAARYLKKFALQDGV